MERILGTILILLILFLLMVIPLLLTILNILFLFKKGEIRIKRLVIKEIVVRIVTMVLGICYSFILYMALNLKDYNAPIVKNFDTLLFHTPVSFLHLPTFIILTTIGIVGYFMLLCRSKVQPPLVLVWSVSATYIGIGLSGVYLVQLSSHLWLLAPDFDILVVYMGLFSFNYILCAIKQIRYTVDGQVAHLAENDVQYNHKILNACKDLLQSSQGWYILAYILTLPILGVALLFLFAFGQQPDTIVKMFSDTSDWLLSQKVSPPPVEYQDHYLCTVALKGHPRIVRPTRYGIRRGVKIVVNRQLCVANAFEQWLQEQYPKSHKKIRAFYDEHGFPIAKKIRTPLQADVIYILMKPLEYFFVFCLYLFDTKPENRIAMQYTGTSTASREINNG